MSSGRHMLSGPAESARPVRAQTAMGRSDATGSRTTDSAFAVGARVKHVIARLVVETQQGAAARAQRREPLRRDDLGDLLRGHRLGEGRRYLDESCDPLGRGQHHETPIDT